MKDFAIVTCLKNIEACAKKPNVMKQAYQFVLSMLNIPKIEETLLKEIKVAELFKEESNTENEECKALKIHIIHLPFHVDELAAFSRGRINRIEEFINEYCASNKIDVVIYSKLLLERNIFLGNVATPFIGRLLFKSLVSNILNEIYSKRGFRINDLDMAIVHGKSDEELFTYIRLLAPYIKYLTIISDDKEGIEKQVEDFYEETGLSIRVTRDIKSGFRGIDFILSIGDLQPGMKIGTRAVILNYGDSGCSNIVGENIIINGIELRLPGTITTKLGKNVLENFTQLELAEIILCNKLDIPIDEISDKTYEILSKEFTAQAFTISGFEGRHNILKASDIKVKNNADSA